MFFACDGLQAQRSVSKKQYCLGPPRSILSVCLSLLLAAISSATTAADRGTGLPDHPDRQAVCIPLELSAARGNDFADSRQSRRDASAEFLAEAQRQVQQGTLWDAYLSLWKAHRADPTNIGVRNRLGIPERPAGSLTLRRGRENRRDLGWRGGSYVTVRTPHFSVESRADAEATQQLAARLENVYWVWTQVFFPFWADETRVAAAIRGTGRVEALRREPMRVVLLPNRKSYLDALRTVPGVEQSAGFYSPENHATVLYVDPENGHATQHHEIVHQLFGEASARPVSPDVGQESGFWVVEGLACYMESLRFFESYAVVGGWESERLQYARFRVFQQRDRIDRERFPQIGRGETQNIPDLARWYGQAALLVHLMLDGDDDAARERLLDYARRLYAGANPPPLTLPPDLDQQIERFLQVDDAMLDWPPTETSLTKLCLGRTSVTEQGLQQLLEYGLSFSWLDLSALPVGDDVVQQLLAEPTRLKQLNLEATRVGSPLGPLLAECRELTELDLSFSQIGDDVVAQLVACPQLQTVWLTGTRVTDEALPALGRLPNLQSVDVQRTSVTEAGLAEFRRRYPQVEINPLTLAPAE